MPDFTTLRIGTDPQHPRIARPIPEGDETRTLVRVTDQRTSTGGRLA